MGLPRILIYVVSRLIAAIVGGLGLAYNYTGESILTISSDNLGIIGLIAFGVFFIITIVKEIELVWQPKPRIEFDGVSPLACPIGYVSNGQGYVEQGQGYFVRLSFKNNARNPSGEKSTAHSLTAFIRLFDKTENLVDSWDGRWANNGEPNSFPNKWEADKLKLEANNQQAILDIGLRCKGKIDFQGWDNGRYFGAPERKVINAGSYDVQVILAAANYKKKDWWFCLDIPSEPQSDNINQVSINLNRRPRIHMKGSQSK